MQKTVNIWHKFEGYNIATANEISMLKLLFLVTDNLKLL
jgi:hypothetical protein